MTNSSPGVLSFKTHKKIPPLNCFKDGSNLSRYHLNSSLPHSRNLINYRSKPIVWHYNRCTCRSLFASYARSVRSSETMFKEAFHIPSHLPGLSATYLFSYSSLHCLSNSHLSNYNKCMPFLLNCQGKCLRMADIMDYIFCTVHTPVQ